MSSKDCSLFYVVLSDGVFYNEDGNIEGKRERKPYIIYASYCPGLYSAYDPEEKVPTEIFKNELCTGGLTGRHFSKLFAINENNEFIAIPHYEFPQELQGVSNDLDGQLRRLKTFLETPGEELKLLRFCIKKINS